MVNVINNLALVWDDLKVGIDIIFKHEALNATKYMDLYTNVFNYCTYVEPQVKPGSFSQMDSNNGGKIVGHELYKKLRDYLKSYVQTVKQKGDLLENNDILAYYQASWKEYKFSAKVLNGTCSYLNRNWVKREKEEGRKNVYEIYALALLIWKENLLKPHSSQLINAILKEIERQRCGETINTERLKQIIESFSELGKIIEGNNPQNVYTFSNQSLISGRSDLSNHGMGNPSVSHHRPSNSAGVKSTNPSSSSSKIPSDQKVDLGFYREYFEERFLKETEKFYLLESTQFLQNNSIIDYLKKVEARINEETVRIINYLHSSTEPKLIKICDQFLIGDHIDKIIKEFTNLINEDRKEDISRLYKLVSRIPDGFENVVMILEEDVFKNGIDAIAGISQFALNDPKVYIETIMKVKSRYQTFVLNSCNSDPAFAQAIDKGCERFVNKNAVTELFKSKRKTPELLARYIDFLLKKSPKVTSDDVEKSLDGAMDVFNYVEDKDVFLNFYSKFLAKRLVANLSISNDIELNMISKLNQTQGFEFTTKLQRLYNDVELSKELKEPFLEYVKNKNHNISIDFNVNIISSNVWPFQSCPQFSIPPELEKCFNVLTEYYNEQHVGRKLSWCYQYSKGELTTNYAKDKHFFQVSTYQMSVLMLFNDSLNLTFNYIREQTGIEVSLLQQILQQLIKAKVLLLTSNGERTQESSDNQIPIDQKPLDAQSDGNLDNDSVISLNLDYKNKRVRVNLISQLKSDTRQEIESTMNNVDSNRKYIIQAGVVRIMKARKTIKHQELIMEVIDQLSDKFKPQINLIKQAIGVLIEKGYLARNQDDKDTYEYQA